MKNQKISVLMSILLLSAQISYAKQAIFKYIGNETQITTRWDWALETARSEKIDEKFWIAYSIQKRMGLKSHIGCYNANEKGLPTLQEIIEHGSNESKLIPNDDVKDRMIIEHLNSGNEKVLKEIAILFKISLNKSKKPVCHDVKISNTDLHFNLQGLPLIWLGQTETDASVDFLDNVYSQATDFRIKKSLIPAIGIHPPAPGVFKFLKAIVENNAKTKLRKDATFWLGQQDSKDALRLLKKTVKSDPSSEVRKSCVFAIQCMEIPEAIDILIDLARKAESKKIRKEAIFWLSQKAGKRAAEAIENAAFSEETTEVQKQAVFALSQLPKDEGIPRLIKVAKTHPNPRVRKNAIFWLGQSDDERALEVLVELVQK